jgi:hypothetical protein
VGVDETDGGALLRRPGSRAGGDRLAADRLAHSGDLSPVAMRSVNTGSTVVTAADLCVLAAADLIIAVVSQCPFEWGGEVEARPEPGNQQQRRSRSANRGPYPDAAGVDEPDGAVLRRRRWHR